MYRPMLLACLLVAAPAAAATELELFTASVTGTLTIAPDGTVGNVDLDGSGIGVSAAEGYERHIRTWRFEPVVVNGVPVVAKARMSLSLIAVRETGSDTANYGIRNVWFTDTRSDDLGNPIGKRTRVDPPEYPAAALRKGFGAEVLLRIQIADDGLAVARADAERVSMLGPAAGKLAQPMAEKMVDAAVEAAARWRIQGYGPGDHVRVPVRFTPGRGSGWQRFHPVAWERAPWIVAAAARDDEVTDVSTAGAAPSRLQLLTELPSVPGYEEG